MQEHLLRVNEINKTMKTHIPELYKTQLRR